MISGHTLRSVLNWQQIMKRLSVKLISFVCFLLTVYEVAALVDDDCPKPAECDAEIPASSVESAQAAFSALAHNSKVSAIAIHFDLEVKGTNATTSLDVGHCDAALSSDSKSSDTNGYYHPLRQIWMRTSSPSEALFLPPDSTVLSLGLLANGPLHVHSVCVPLQISSLCCWSALNQSEQSSITLALAVNKMAVGDDGLLTGEAQLCQLRYNAKGRYSNNDPASSRDFSYTCCTHANRSNELSCTEKSHFSSWYDQNTFAVVAGLLLAALISPLPFMGMAAPSSGIEHELDDPVGGPNIQQSYRPKTASFATAQGAELTSSSSGEEEARRRLLRPARNRTAHAGRRIVKTRHLSLDSDLPFSLTSAIWNTSIPTPSPPVAYMALATGNVGETSCCTHASNWNVVTLWGECQLGKRFKLLFWFLLPAALSAIRAVTYRAVIGDDLKCMVKLNIATPLLLYLFNWEYMLIGTYLTLAVLCLAANPTNLLENLKDEPQGNNQSSRRWIPAYPTAYKLPSAQDSGSSGDSRSSIVVGARHILDLYLHSSVALSFLLRFKDAHDFSKRLTHALLFLLCVPIDIFIFAAATVDVILINMPTGYLFLRVSQAAGGSVCVNARRRRHVPATAMRVVLGVIWFASLLGALLFCLVLALWLILSVQYTFLGVLYSLDKYFIYLLQAGAVVGYFYHYWQGMQAKYVHLKLMLINEVRQLRYQSDLVSRVKVHIDRIVHDRAAGSDKPKPSAPSPAAQDDPFDSELSASTVALLRDTSNVKVPTELYMSLVDKHFPVRYVFFQAILRFVIVCIYLAVLNATVVMLAQLQQYSAFSRSLGLLVGTALPRAMSAIQNDASDQLQQAGIQENIRQAIVNFQPPPEVASTEPVTHS